MNVKNVTMERINKMAEIKRISNESKQLERELEGFLKNLKVKNPGHGDLLVE